MTDNTSPSYLADVMYHDFVVVQSAEVLKLTATEGFLRLSETLPVGTAVKLKLKKTGDESHETVGPKVPATVTQVHEASSKDKGANTGMEVSFQEEGQKSLQAFIDGTWVGPEPGEEPQEPVAAKPAEPIPPREAKQQEKTQFDEVQTTEQETQPAEEHPPPEEEQPIPEEFAAPSDTETQEEDDSYQKAGTIQGVPVMVPPDGDESAEQQQPAEEQKPAKTKKRKRSKRKKKKDA